MCIDPEISYIAIKGPMATTIDIAPQGDRVRMVVNDGCDFAEHRLVMKPGTATALAARLLCAAEVAKEAGDG
tara:strand:+ start:1879 stop:2094 length:216 start_codon:yes stop_codon:yes gene_type:complete